MKFETIPLDDVTETYEMPYDEMHLSIEIDKQLSTLTKREREVLEWWSGFFGKKRLRRNPSFDYNVTPGRIWQIRNRALRKLKHPSRSRVLRQYLETYEPKPNLPWQFIQSERAIRITGCDYVINYNWSREKPLLTRKIGDDIHHLLAGEPHYDDWLCFLLKSGKAKIVGLLTNDY